MVKEISHSLVGLPSTWRLMSSETSPTVLPPVTRNSRTEEFACIYSIYPFYLLINFNSLSRSLRSFCVPDLVQVEDVRLHAEIFQHPVSTRVTCLLIGRRCTFLVFADLKELAQLAFRIVHITKHNRACGTSCSACCVDLSIFHRATILLRSQLAMLDTLSAERTLLHYTT